jgi:TRAP-type C4-dicarboxylate transport system permease large subunit
VIAAAIATVFAIFAFLMYRRLLPAILALPLMAVVMALVAGVPFSALGTIVVGGASDLSQVYVAVIFGALLGRVTMDTGIARAMVNLAAEYGGERSFALAMVLCAIVAVLFTSLSGLGAIIMVGSIVLPIMMTVGVPRTVAATLFLMSFALGFIFNIANWTFYTKYFGVAQEQMVRYALVLAVIDAVVLVAYAVVAFRREREYATWATRAEPAPAPRVPAWALLTPVLPIVLYYALKMPATPAFMISALYGVLVTRPRDAVQTLVAAAIRGVEDVAPAVLLFVGIGMLLVATQQPQFAAALQPLAGGWIANPVLYVVVFGVASPLALYRGPLNPFGVGIAIFTVLLAANAVPPVILVAAIMAVVQVQNVCDPTNTANVWVANFTGVHIDTITKRTLPYQVAVASAATLAVVAASPQLFGVRAFHSPIPAARADTLDGGFYAPDNASGRVGVGDDGSALGRVAAQAVAKDLDANGRRALLVRDDANDGDCTRKPYAAYAYVSVSQFTLIEGDDLDVGVRLEDCGGWIVQEWHDHRVVPAPPSDAAVRDLALEGAARLRAWSAADPGHSGSLFLRGVAAAPGDPPTYFFALFKTVDGNMRTYVRGGGPAYAAGMRSGDVVNKIDGKFWWEYGTFQTQLRAYDGKPHAFEVQRGGQTFDIRLGAPFVPATGGTS